MVQIDRKFKNKNYPILIGISHIQELNIIEKLENGMIIGAGTTITRFKEHLKLWLQILPKHQLSTCHAPLSQFNIFGSQQTRNVATIGGNIIHGSPISSLTPILQACDAKLNLIKCSSSHEQYEVALREFFLSDKKIDVEQDDILLSVFIPFSEKYEYLGSYKQLKKRKLDIPIVSCGVQVKLKLVQYQIDSSLSQIKWSIQSVCLSFGSMAPSTIMMNKTEDYLKNKP